MSEKLLVRKSEAILSGVHFTSLDNKNLNDMHKMYVAIV